MPIVTVPGAANTSVTLSFDRDANALLALHVAGVIAAGLGDNSIFAWDNQSGTPPPLAPGVTGELVTTQPGSTVVPSGYDYVVDSSNSQVIFGNGDANEQVLAGDGNLKFFASAGSGAVIAGGGNDLVSIASSDLGDWLIATGNGADSILALGGGFNTINVGTGADQIQLGAGSAFVTMNGPDTVLASSGSETIDASGSSGGDLIFGNSSKLFFLAGGSATVIGGTGSDTVTGGTGSDLFEGGLAGNNVLRAGSGSASLFGGGNGDQLYANGSGNQFLHAAGGNETLAGTFASGNDVFYGGPGSDQIFGGQGSDTFVAGSGAATVTASPLAMNLFDFMKTLGGGSELVVGLFDPSQVTIALTGYAASEVNYALSHQTTANGAVTITLSDSTTVTFENISGLTKANFLTGGGTASG